MKKKSKTFLIILSLFVCLLASCGIPNYFGNISKYVSFNASSNNSHRLRISIRDYADGFDPRDVKPKLMFLYTIHSHSASTDQASTVTYQLKNKFLSDYKLSDYDYKGCTAQWNGPVSTIEIKDADNKDITRNYGIYQLKTTGDKLNPENTELPTNYSSDYLFNVDNMNFEYNKDYTFTYTLEGKEGSSDVKLVITCKDDSNNVIASYYMGNYEGKDFHTKFSASDSEDYRYTGQSTKLYILPVLYLESNKYSNRQMMIGEWRTIDLSLPDELQNHQPNSKPITP